MWPELRVSNTEMKLLFRRWTVFVLILCSLATPAWGQSLTGPSVDKIEIRHIGPPAASDAMIRANVRVKEGDIYTKTGVDDDVRSLFSTGFFYNVRVATEAADKGIKIIYVVQGKPTVSEIRIEGNNKFSRKKILKKVTFKPGDPLDERKLFADAQEITKLYQKAGYQKTTVKATPNIEEAAGRGSVTFEVKEAPKVKIENVEFVGAEAFTQRKLRKQIKTRRLWMFSWLTGTGVLKDEQFDEDKEKLAEFYHEAGYIDFEIKDTKFDNVSDKRMRIQFDVNEGAQYKVGSVEIKGNTEFKTEQIMAGIVSEGRRVRPKMVPGQIFTPKGLTADVDAIRDYYGSLGYIDTWVKTTKYPNTERGTMDLIYQIMDEEKGRSYVEKIEIKGNIKTRDTVLRRELAITPGEPFDMVRVKVTKARLEQMGYFDKVETETDATDVPNRKNLIIDVEEGSTGHVELGAGFSSIDSLFGFVGYREGNFDLFHPPYFRGGGQKLRVGVTVGLRRKDYQISFVEPWFLGRRLALGVDLYHSELNYYSDLYDFRQTGDKLSLTKQLPYNMVGSVNYTIENIGLSINGDPSRLPQSIQKEALFGDQLISKVGASLAYDTRNSSQLPNRGQRSEILPEFAGGPLGGDAGFYRLEARSAWYFPGFATGHIIEVAGRIGVADPLSDSPHTDELGAATVPFFYKYFLGGVNSLRGYKYREVGPKIGDEPIGGDSFTYGTVEYSVPIIERLRVAAFYDVGNVWPQSYHFDFGDLVDNVGLGVRLNIPRLGPLRLDYGIPIRHGADTSDSGRFQFSVGFTRDY